MKEKIRKLFKKQKAKRKKIALVTGSSSGFGMLTCIELLKADFAVIATMRDFEKKDDLINAAKELELTHLLNVLPLDVTNDEDIQKVKNIVEKAYGKIDILINNAGYCQGGFVDDLSLDDWKNQFETNVHGSFRMIKMFTPLLEQSEYSQIINVGSISGMFGFPGMSAYTSSKFALRGFSESLRLELLPKRIYVSLVEPASYKTRIWEKSLSTVPLTDTGNSLKSKVFAYAKNAARNSANPIEVAELIAEICEEKRPKFRYPIGGGAKYIEFLKLIFPWMVVERATILLLKRKWIRKGLSALTKKQGI